MLNKTTVVPVWKRVVDVGCVLVTLPITLPLSLAVASYVKLNSKGSVLFRQERVGLGCKTFTCYKFRSMIQDASTQSHQGPHQETHGIRFTYGQD